MRIGVPKEIKDHEYRVGLVPSSIQELCLMAHYVFVHSPAGVGGAIDDEDYARAGAQILQDEKQVYEKADLIIKVKEPSLEECKLLRPDQILFAYLHLAAYPEQGKALLASGCTAIAYETVTDDFGGLPLLAPMSEVAGRMAIQAGAHCLEKAQGGRGVLLGGVPGVEAARVVVIGGGVVGTNAVRIAMGMEARVTVLDKSLKRLKELDLQFGCRLNTIYATSLAIERYVVEADLVIGAVLIPGAAAPKLVTREMVSKMRLGSVLVDVAIDQGGCFETSRPTTHSDPIFTVDGVIHYCVVNMPGAVARTSTFALNNATLPFILALTSGDPLATMTRHKHLANGLNVHRGKVMHKGVAEALNLPYHAIENTAL
jgi:alanine dehydrogenase